METATEPINDNPQTTEKKKTTVRILLADDHPIVRDGLKKLLQLEPLTPSERVSGHEMR